MPSKYDRKRKRALDADTSTDSRWRRGRDEQEEAGNRSSSGDEAENNGIHSHGRIDTAKRPKRGRSPAGRGGDGRGEGKEETLSIEETNKLRASLGLAPLEVDTAPTTTPAEGDEDAPKLAEGEKLFTEDGVKIVHKAAKSLVSEKESAKIREKLETAKQKRGVQSRVLKVTKGLAESSDEEVSGGAEAWVERTRRLEEERKRAEEKRRLLDEMDEEALKTGDAEPSRPRSRAPQRGGTSKQNAANLVVGHSQKEFLDDTAVGTVLVLQDKDVLDEGDEEVLINPNMLENERHRRNVETRKSGKAGTRPWEEEDTIDEFTGEVVRPSMLSKYDGGLDGEGKKKETFRLDTSGSYDLDKETREAEVRRKLMMADKKFVSLEKPKYQVASEFYTSEEMLSFRKPKKKKDFSTRKERKKTLKASDLAPQAEPISAETEEEREARMKKLLARQRDIEAAGGVTDRKEKASFKPTLAPVDASAAADAAKAGTEKEEGEIEEESEPRRSSRHSSSRGGTSQRSSRPDKEGADEWKSSMGASVDMDKLKRLAQKQEQQKRRAGGESDEEDDGDDDDDDLMGSHAGQNLLGIHIDDEAEDELGRALERARTQILAQAAAKIKAEEDGGEAPTGIHHVHALLRRIKDEQEEAMDEEESPYGGTSSSKGGKKQIVFDATSEQYKAIGEFSNVGLAGNREHGVEYSEPTAEPSSSSHLRHQTKAEPNGDSDVDMEAVAETLSKRKSKHHRKEKRSHRDKEDGDKKEKRRRSDEKRHSKGKDRKWDGGEEKPFRRELDDEEGEDYTNVLGEERDTTVGVAAMLKLAAVKGYLENSGPRQAGDGSLKHLESQRYSRVDQGRWENVDEKTLRKLERMGTTGSGPTRSFEGKRDTKPHIEISYPDAKGRLMGAKEAFRALSWKFHGKGPGKKQVEKHAAKLEKKDRLKQMNSSDTPLGTLTKQKKKQEQLQTPYLILSGQGRDTGAPLQKD